MIYCQSQYRPSFEIMQKLFKCLMRDLVKRLVSAGMYFSQISDRAFLSCILAGSQIVISVTIISAAEITMIRA